MSDTPVQLIVGLGNPGPKYAGTRHNAGFWFVDALARDAGGSFALEAKFFGEICRVDCGGHDVRLLKPDTYMNESGRSVQAVARFFKIPAEGILVAYDEIDLAPGRVKLKKGGGHGGHNGLRDMLRHLDADFIRLRLGVGHPGHKDLVSNYVLGNPTRDDEDKILTAMGRAIDIVPALLGDGLQKATHLLHSDAPAAQKAPNKRLVVKDKTPAAAPHVGTNSSDSGSAKKSPRKKQPSPAREAAASRNEEQEIKARGGLKEQLLALLKRNKK